MKKLLLLLVLLTALVHLTFPPNAFAQVDNFTITGFKVDMRLSRDEQKRSVLETTETITAQFPDYDQNRGLERVIVEEYDNHPTSFKLVSVTDGEGNELNYHWSEDALRIGDADKYVHGRQVYKITYTQRDVTKLYEDTGKQEFYWDVIGVEWRVPISNIELNLTVDESLRGSIATDLQCYAGSAGQNDSCGDVNGSAGNYTIKHDNLAPYQGITTALGFKPETFNAYEPSLLDRFFQFIGIVQAVSLPVAIAALVWLIFRINRSTERKAELKPIVPEYLPPKDVSVLTSAQIYRLLTSVMAAQLIDLAVRHYIKLYQTKEKKLLSPAEYEVEISKDLSDLKWEEKELLSDMFGNLPQPGARLNLKTLKNNTGYFNRTLNNDKDLRKLIYGDYGLREEDKALKSFLYKFALVSGILAVVLLSLPLLVLTIISLLCVFAAWRLTDKGLALKQYLLGLKHYISVAEEERIKIMQSPEGTEKYKELSAASKDVKQRVVLYEKVLPYAILFGQEKQWNQHLGRYYEQSGRQPDWYHSHGGAFSSAAFASGMSDLKSATTSASSSSSISGGSSGGGSSGGGGGGGGGGGW